MTYDLNNWFVKSGLHSISWLMVVVVWCEEVLLYVLWAIRDLVYMIWSWLVNILVNKMLPQLTPCKYFPFILKLARWVKVFIQLINSNDVT